MPHSLRAKLSGLHYKGKLEDKDYKRLCKALDNESVLDKIRDEIKDAYDDNRACEQDDVAYGLKVALDIIKEHTKGDNT